MREQNEKADPFEQFMKAARENGIEEITVPASPESIAASNERCAAIMELFERLDRADEEFRKSTLISKERTAA